jgi:hypothetical protein
VRPAPAPPAPVGGIVEAVPIGGCLAIPSRAVFIRLDGSGNLDTARADNLVVGRSNLT